MDCVVIDKNYENINLQAIAAAKPNTLVYEISDNTKNLRGAIKLKSCDSEYIYAKQKAIASHFGLSANKFTFHCQDCQDGKMMSVWVSNHPVPMPANDVKYSSMMPADDNIDKNNASFEDHSYDDIDLESIVRSDNSAVAYRMMRQAYYPAAYYRVIAYACAKFDRIDDTAKMLLDYLNIRNETLSIEHIGDINSSDPDSENYNIIRMKSGLLTPEQAHMPAIRPDIHDSPEFRFVSIDGAHNAVDLAGMSLDAKNTMFYAVEDGIDNNCARITGYMSIAACDEPAAAIAVSRHFGRDCGMATARHSDCNQALRLTLHIDDLPMSIARLDSEDHNGMEFLYKSDASLEDLVSAAIDSPGIFVYTKFDNGDNFDIVGYTAICRDMADRACIDIESHLNGDIGDIYLRNNIDGLDKGLALLMISLPGCITTDLSRDEEKAPEDILDNKLSFVRIHSGEPDAIVDKEIRSRNRFAYYASGTPVDGRMSIKGKISVDPADTIKTYNAIVEHFDCEFGAARMSFLDGEDNICVFDFEAPNCPWDIMKNDPVRSTLADCSNGFKIPGFSMPEDVAAIYAKAAGPRTCFEHIGLCVKDLLKHIDDDSISQDTIVSDIASLLISVKIAAVSKDIAIDKIEKCAEIKAAMMHVTDNIK